MGKLKKLTGIKISSYFRELSIVIIGVAVTLFASSMIGSLQEKRDTKLLLNAVYMELEDNMSGLNTVRNHYEDVAKLNKLLVQDYYYPGSVEEDSISNLNHVVGRSPTYVYKRNAYDMFVNSGAMKTFPDKKLLLDITECYSSLEVFKEKHDDYMNAKIDLIKELYNFDTKLVMGNINIKDFRSLYNFFLVSTGNIEQVIITREVIGKVLANRK